MKMRHRSILRHLQSTDRPFVSFTLAALLMAGAVATAHAEEWRVLVGVENGTRGSQALTTPSAPHRGAGSRDFGKSTRSDDHRIISVLRTLGLADSAPDRRVHRRPYSL
jgi:hypothetical protein